MKIKVEKSWIGVLRVCVCVVWNGWFFGGCVIFRWFMLGLTSVVCITHLKVAKIQSSKWKQNITKMGEKFELGFRSGYLGKTGPLRECNLYEGLCFLKSLNKIY